MSYVGRGLCDPPVVLWAHFESQLWEAGSRRQQEGVDNSSLLYGTELFRVMSKRLNDGSKICTVQKQLGSI